MKSIHFDHTYTADPNHKFFKKLKNLGFTVSPDIREHPGGMVCRFIRFKTENTKRGVQYLEFIHVKKGGEPFTHPGISFGCNIKLETIFQKLKTRFDCRLKHRNYDWKTSKNIRGPGWNFLNFRNLGFRGFYPWMTEYELIPKMKYKKPPLHPNGVNEFVAIEFDINKASSQFFKKLIGSDISCQLPCGTRLILRHSKRTTITRIVLKSKDVLKFAKKYKLPLIEYQGQPGALISNPYGKWDIVIV